MAMVAGTKLPYPQPQGMNSTSTQAPSSLHALQNHRTQQPAASNNHTNFASPTESEFSEALDAPDSVKSWDERRVAEWLRSINCGQYEAVFRANHFNGENLLECDQVVLKELGIKKIGDRVRIFVAIKGLRNKAYANQRKRNRDSFAALDGPSYPTMLAGSPRPSNTPDRRGQQSSQTNKRVSRIFDGSALPYNLGKMPSRPSSPAFDSEGKPLKPPRFGGTPTEGSRRDQNQGYFSNSNPSSAHTVSGRRPGTPNEMGPPQSTRAPHRHQGSLDGSVMGSLPSKMPCVRVIYAGGETKVVSIQKIKTGEEITRATLRKFGLREDHVKNFCFYVLEGNEPNPAHCRRIPDAELAQIASDTSRPERNRLILRKLHWGEPGDEELQRAAEIATEETNSQQNAPNAMASHKTKSQLKVSKLTGEPIEAVQYPLSPESFRGHHFTSPTSDREREREREHHVNEAAQDLERADPWELSRTQARKKGILRQFFGQRPPSELISSDLATYFPEHEKADIEHTVRMSIRRSARLSRATSRLSMASLASSLRDAPPMPSIADAWKTPNNQPAMPNRPLSLTRFALPQTSYRDSVASSMLEPLAEESPVEPNRKSYVSFESGSDSASGAANDNDTHDDSALQSYFDDTNTSSLPATEAGSSLNETLSKALAEDGEERDEELTSFLAGDSWDNIKWMKGTLIGQGSFGSVYLALHAITGELMAVKQVEVPSSQGSQVDNKKKGMVDALKREIGLLRELQHPNIVQYLGSSSDDEHLNIFLEYVPGGSVAAMLNSYGPLNEALIRNFVRQILTGLAYLHGREIIHRDIKGANVLVDNKGGIKISDFGISKRVEASSLLGSSGAGHHHRPSLQGSVFWMAPEVVKQTSYTRKADIWSLGCLVVEMFTGNHPYPDCSQLQAIFKIGNSKASPNMPDNASEEAQAFLAQTFEVDHTKRPSADELLTSPFLNQTA
ncbi:MAG: TFIIH complex serine/threonine-protein kinase subunit kin28 [Chaenotheca gracillima]|nr:MAG: TFIIH complex serine/threonine-protein kinase subunit kin28 [Chaenotheca gracillima]